MTPIYKKLFDSPVLTELNTLAQKEWMLLNSIDLTKEEFQELWDIFHDPEYHKDKFVQCHNDLGYATEYHKDKFVQCHNDLGYAKIIITVDGMNGIEYIKQQGYLQTKPTSWMKW